MGKPKPYAKVYGNRVVILSINDIGKYCRDFNLTWDEFWKRARCLEKRYGKNY